MKVHYVSAYSREKNIGKAINDSIRQLKADDEDWICSTDHDILWLLPDSKAQLEDILSKTTFDVLGPLTNRLGGRTQLIFDMYDETDILRHIAVAQDRDNAYRGDVVGTQEILAAFCLCFRVKTWKALGGFQENSLQFDWYFSEMAKKMGFKLGIMVGLYVYHLYRTGRDKNDYSHLL